MKAFAFESGLRLMAPWLDGFHASSAFEARLAREVKPDGLVHTTAPGARPQDYPEMFRFSDRFSFNSVCQWIRFRSAAEGTTSPGLRVNPDLSFVTDERYDPSARHSKLGVPIDDVAGLVREYPEAFDGIEGLLVHNNCESTDFTELLQVVQKVVQRLDPLLRRIRWVNLGGGYLFGAAGDPSALRHAVGLLQDTYGVDVLFEPGTSLVSRAGSIVATVVDLVASRGRTVAVLDTSVSHCPEVLEYQYVPDVTEQLTPAADTTVPSAPLLCAARQPGISCPPELRAGYLVGALSDPTYVLAGASCLAGDLFGEHHLDRLEVGSRVVIANVGAYSMVQASWFNGIALPTVYSRDASGLLTLRRRYTYEDFIRHNGGTDADH
jgi:carboxynorspermidine decarboxylase